MRHPDYNAPILDLDGDPIKANEDNPEDATLLTLKIAIIGACNPCLKIDVESDGIARAKIGEIAACASRNLPLTNKQILTVKDRIGRRFGSNVLIYLLHEALDKASASAPKVNKRR